MNTRTVLSLLLGVAVLVGMLLFLGRDSSESSQTGELLFAELRTDINALEKITISAPGNTVIASLTAVEGRWELAERPGQPADTGKLRQLLLALADARLVEAKTSNPEYYSRLGVEDIAAADAGGTLVEIETGDNNYAVIVGDEVQGEYRYVRRPGEAGSWLIDTNPEAPARTADWLDRTLIDIDTASIHSVTIRHADGETINLVKANPGTTDFTVLDIPSDRELLYASVANASAGALDSLTLDDAAKTQSSSDAETITTFKTFDGRVIEVTAESGSDERWIRIAASYDDGLAQQFSPGSETDEAGPPTATLQDRPPPEEIRERVAALNDRVAGNRYQIPSFKYEQLTRRWSDLLKQP